MCEHALVCLVASMLALLFEIFRGYFVLINKQRRWGSTILKSNLRGAVVIHLDAG